MTIRDFIQEDWEAYLAMSKDFYSSDAVLHAVPEEHFRATFDACLAKSPYTRGLAFEEGGAVVGYGLLSFTWANEAGGLCVLLEEAYILPSHQGKGYGSGLLRFVEEEYAGKARRFRLEVTQSNEGAVRLYERMGYKRFDYLQMVKDV